MSVFDETPTPPVRSPSVALVISWAEDCDADADRCEDAARKLLVLAKDFRAFASAFRAWEHGKPDPKLRDEAYAKLADLRIQMRDLLR